MSTRDIIVIGGSFVDGQHRGFGTELLEQTLAYDLKAKTQLDFDPAGFRCVIELPITDRLFMPARLGLASVEGP
jgi:hypothetical protein